MRDIKFRAWHKEKNIMVYDNEDDTYGYWDGCCNSNVGMVNTILNSKWYKQYEFMQYTGLKDENEKEIYEGDIIDFSYDMFVGNFDTFVAKGVVVFDEGAFYVELFENERTTKDEAYLLYSINTDSIEVIGNIYENKDLLKKEGK